MLMLVILWWVDAAQDAQSVVGFPSAFADLLNGDDA